MAKRRRRSSRPRSSGWAKPSSVYDQALGRSSHQHWLLLPSTMRRHWQPHQLKICAKQASQMRMQQRFTKPAQTRLGRRTNRQPAAALPSAFLRARSPQAYGAAAAAKGGAAAAGGNPFEDSAAAAESGAKPVDSAPAKLVHSLCCFVNTSRVTASIVKKACEIV